MNDLFDKVLLAGKGLEHKIKEVLDDLAKEGEKTKDEGIKVAQEFENRVVEEVVKVVGVSLKKVGLATKEIEKVLASVAEGLAERLKIVTLDDLDVIEKLVLKNRDKITKFEKRIKKLEQAVAGLTEKQ